ncbi:MAG: hypothetical protein WCG27_00935 [Pseudomonadota bacterium]
MAKSGKDKDKKENRFSDMIGKIVPSDILQSAVGAKDEITSILRQEISKRLPSLDLHHLIDEVLKKYDFDIRATVSLKEKKKSSKDNKEDKEDSKS